MITTTTTTLANCEKAASDILAIIDDLGFTTDRAFDPPKLKDRIAAAIMSNIQTGTGEIITVDVVEEQEPTEADLDELLSQIEEEEQEQHIHANECLACGQLIR